MEAWVEQRSVASLADAWIKINTGREADVDWTVASLADAWIKIKAVLDNMPDAVQSHPSRMRGLKQGNGSVGGTEERHIPRGCVD